MDLTKFGEELKKLRLDKQVSLMDISFSTRINIKFLEAMEAGRFSVLPQAYVRAFLREYGEAVGLTADEIMLRYDGVREELNPSAPREARPIAPLIPTLPMPKSVETKKPIAFSSLKKNLGFAAIIIAAVAFVFYLRNSSSKPLENTPEISFDSVVKESEATTYKPDTLARIVLPAPVIKADSLRLEIISSDSVWISILIDGKRTVEYLFPPNRSRLLTAKDQFSITMGNAGGAVFKLNGRDLGTLGRRGAVVRNVLLNEARLKNQ
jgi:hypothetical protein